MIVVDAARYDEDDLMPAIDAGAQDIALDDDVYEIVTEPSDLAAVRESLEAGRASRSKARTSPNGRSPASRVDEADAARLLKLIDTLEESDDVGAVHANFDVDADRCSSAIAG